MPVSDIFNVQAPVRFGSLADLQDDISLMSALERIADVQPGNF
jgi:hypothetical protein